MRTIHSLLVTSLSSLILIQRMAQDFVKKKVSRTSPTKKEAITARKRKPVAKTNVNKTEKRKVNSRKPNSPKKSAPFWAWILTGISVIGFGFFLTQLSNSNQEDNTSQADTKKANAEVKVAEQVNDSQVKFDFYEILKGKEVNVDERVIEKTPEQKNIIYFLQAGSFKQLNDADTLRAKLLLQGLPVSIEKTTNKNGQEWHRVVAGPFDTRSKLAKARGVLASNEINSIVLKR
jgi:cell division protein FtsN